MAPKFQKIHSELIIEDANKQFVSEAEKAKLNGALLAQNNLSDIPNKAEAITNLGLDNLGTVYLINDRVPITNGSFELTREPISNKIIFDICYVVNSNNEIIAEEYKGLVINGALCQFIDNDPLYEGMECMVSYISFEA